MPIAFVFPGQGSQKVGMGKELFDACPSVRKRFLCASEVVGLDLAKLCFEGPSDELSRTDRAQPALLTLDVACLELIAGIPVTSDRKGMIVAVAGHSLGEYAALVAAGVLTFDDAVRLVAERGRLMHKAPAGVMAAIIGLDRVKTEDCLRDVNGTVVTANFNAPGQVVISGSPDAIEAAMERAKIAGAKQVVRLNVSGAFHSPLMQQASEQLSVRIAQTTFAYAHVPVITNVDAKPKKNPEELRFALTQQMTSSVLWEESVATMRAMGANLFVECGPGRVLSGLIRRCDRDAKTLNVEDLKSLEEARTLLDECISPSSVARY